MNPTNSECYALDNHRWRKCGFQAKYIQQGSGIPLCRECALELARLGAKIKPITPNNP